MKRLCILFMSVMLLPELSFSQRLLSGKLTDPEGISVGNATIAFREPNSSVMQGFTRSAADGSFRLHLKETEADSVLVEISHLGFEKKVIALSSSGGDYHFILKPGSQQIQEVRVGNPPIFRRRDTINYQVDAFRSPEDRVIADIIRRLPGVEIDNGSITYQGEPIQRFTVNNLDLMGSRYGLISDNLSIDAVRHVQIIENDQPIKILDSVVFSNRASLNLEIKKYTTTATGRLGVGWAPALWDMAITPITLGQNFQMLNTFQTNNIGIDVTEENTLSTQVEFVDPPLYSAISAIGNPDFDQKKWLNNALYLGSNHSLWKLDNQWELKSNLTYFQDQQQKNAYTEHQLYHQETVSILREEMTHHDQRHFLSLGATLEKNHDDFYFTNNFKFRRKWNHERSSLLFNTTDLIGQQHKFEDIGWLNQLSTTFFMGKQLMNFHSKLEWHRSPQRFVVVPGPMEEILNEGMPYEEVTQWTRTANFNSENSLSFLRKYGYWRINPGLRLHYHAGSLDTDIELRDDIGISMLGSEFRNAVSSRLLKAGVDADIFYEKSRWKWAFHVPIMTHVYQIQQEQDEDMNPPFRTTISPLMRTTFLLNRNHAFNGNITAGRTFESIDRQYPAYILKSYRSLQRYDVRLMSYDYLRGSLGYSYMNTRKAQSASLNYSWSHRLNDYLYQHQVDSDGKTTIDLIDQAGATSSHMLSTSLSQAFLNLKTNVRIDISGGRMRSDYLLNGAKHTNQTRLFNTALRLYNNKLKFVSGEYRGRLQFRDIHFSAQRSEQILHLDHFLNFHFFLTRAHTLIVNNALYTNTLDAGDKTYFLDLTYRYTLTKWKMDVELTCSNLFDQRNYVRQYMTDYQLSQTHYELRPRQAMLTLKYSF